MTTMSRNPLEVLAERLSDALARECLAERWIEMHAADRHSMIAACEWLLMDWSLLESARLSHIRENLGITRPPQLDIPRLKPHPTFPRG